MNLYSKTQRSQGSYWAGLQAFNLILVLALLIQPISPSLAFALDENGENKAPAIDSTTSHSSLASPVEIIEKLGRAVASNSSDVPMRLSPEGRNTFYLLNQFLVDTKKGVTTKLSELDLSRNPVNIPPGVLETKLDVKADAGSIVISYGRKRYSHKIELSAAERVLDIATTNEYVYVLVSDGKILSIDVSTLRYFLLKSSVPVFVVSKVADIAEDSKLTVIQRRIQPLGSSLSESKTALNKNPEHIEKLVATASRKDLEALEQKYSKLEYTPLSLKLSQQTQFLKAGDIGVTGITASGSTEIDSIVPKSHMSAEVASQTSVFQAMLALTNPDPDDALKEIQRTSDQAQQDIQNLLRDPARVQDYYQSGLAEALLTVPRDAVAKIVAHAQNVQASDLEVTARDLFSESQWKVDSDFFARTIAKARSMRKESIAPNWVRSTAFLTKKRWKALIQPESVRRLTRVMACTSAACAAAASDTAFGDGIATKHAIDFISGSMFWLTHQFPVLADTEYRKILTLSVLSQASIPLIVFSAATIASFFTKYKISQIPTMVGIRIFARIFQVSPIRMLTSLTRQRAAFHALKAGYNADLVSPFPTEGRRAGEAKINAQVRKGSLVKSFSTVYALAAASIHSGVDAGEIFLAANGDTDYNKTTHQSDALRISRDVQSQLMKVDSQTALNVLKGKSAELVRELNKYYLVGDKLAKANFKKGWWEAQSENIKFRVASDVLKSVGNYSEKTYSDLSNALPDGFTSRLTNRGYIVDYTISLATAAVKGDFANPNFPERLHAQADQPLWSSKIVTAENVNQTSIHYGRGAAGTYYVFSKMLSSVNKAHQAAEVFDDAHVEVKKKLPLFKEALRYIKTMALDYRSTNMGELAGQMMYSGRVKLFQSTLLSGAAVRLFLVGQPLEQAVMGQLMFMGCAMWAYGWPWVPFMGTQEIHESRIESNYSRMQKVRLELSLASRNKDLDLAEKAALKLKELYDHADLKHPEIPSRNGISATEYAERLYRFSMKNPAFPYKHSEFIASGATSVVAIVTTVLATYLYTATFSGDIQLGGFNWTDWNLFTGVPKGDGVLSVALKSAIFTGILWEGQRIFNWLWDEARVATTKLSGTELGKLQARRDSSKEAMLDFAPVKVALTAGKKIRKSCRNSFSNAQ